ncbi:hybrid sensor histidine kinase/response regulator [Azospirillum rugosum]|uniref:histidine kinase n=1 Tax=Azospirillum rugosum TaxID=416170 RepID=A0ABS4SJZ0_9PROT|nr:hybrid sensor histidine kinase/response regulator [Azospirillum rugosum]MBP2292871.1 signal transduction histidine kinase/ligand-binding sensor domain-containing protein/CheY-like chemotaxis protein [Azospirillum rugosum]MDQ0529377.1 signal transduction histidine kinase/ligand-binding sensor domain-containing protein/CheY-like chemotaxis protein [Azospirillum rugosum]
MRSALGASVLVLAAAAHADSLDRGSDPWASLSSSLFSHIGPGEGLPYSVGSALAQDGEGYVWIGTPGGLARWDGYRMRVFRHRTEDPDSLPENIVTHLFTDAQGRLWLGTASGLVARYDSRQDRFVTFRDQGSGLGRLSGLADDGEEGAWAVGNSGLAHLDGRSGRWRRDRPEDVGLPPGEIRSVLRDRSGTLWLGTAAGLRRRAAGEERFRAVDGPAGSVVATALFEDSSGTIRFGTAAGRFGSIVGTEARLVEAMAPSGQRVSAIVEPEPGTLWIAEFGGGIRELDVATGAVRSFRNDPASPTSIADDSILGLLVDRSGLVWASGLGGVDRHDPHDRGILTVLPGKPSGLPGKYVRSMTVRADGKVWLAFRDKGIALLDPAAGRIEQVIAPSEEPGNGLPGTMIQAIATPEGGPENAEVWAGTTGGLYRVQAAIGPSSGGTASVFRPLGMANILSLMADGPTLWAGGSMGLARIDPQRGTVELFKHQADRPDSLSDNSVQSLLRDGAGRLWVGTQRGLNLFDPARGAFRRFLHDQDDLTSLPNDIVHTLLEDGQGRLWVGTAGGIGILDPSEEPFDSGRARFRTLNAANGLPHDTVTVLQEGDDGRIWAAGGDRLATIDPQTLTIRNFGPMDGAGIRTHWVGSGARLPDGTLLFGGFGGMTVVKPGRRPQWEFQPPLVATDIRVGGRTVPPSSPIVVTPDDRSVRVEFAALDFSAPERNRYAYRLEPFDDRWTETDAGNRTATYTNLSPGRYTLSIRGTNRDGVWSGHTLSIPLQVLPAWYQTLWFRTAAAIAGLSILVGAVQGWTALLRRRQRELERQVAQRTAEVETERARALAGEAGARRAMEEAEAANRAKSRFLAVVSHEIRTPLNGVLGMLQLLDPKAMDGEQRRYLEIAKTSGNLLASLVESVLEYGRSEAEEDGVELGVVDPRHLVTSAADLFAVQAAGNGVRVDVSIGARVPPAIRCARVRLTRVLHNLLGNAVKFTAQGRITISLDFAPQAGNTRGDLRLSVADTGIGIAPDLREAIFQDFVQADDSITRRFGGTGLGLAVCRRIATTLGGTLTVESTVGVGSTFRLTVPVEAVAEEPVHADETPAGKEAAPLDILLVDDDPVNRLVGQALIGKLGHRVTAVDGGAAAAEAASVKRFDVVLMDMHMPEMDGIEAIRRLRALRDGHPDTLRVVVMTADMTAETRERCRRAGVERVVSKPLHLDAVRNALSDDGAVEAWLDLAFLRVQMDSLGFAGLIRLGRLFARTSRRTLAALEAAAAAGDAEAVRAEAHRLRGAAGVLGLTRLCAAAGAIEARTGGGAELDWDRIASLRALRAGSFKALFRAARIQQVEGVAYPITSPPST